MNTRVVDIHAHVLVPAVEVLVADRPERIAALRAQGEAAGAASTQHNRQLFANEYMPKLTNVATHLAAMDAMGVDMQAVSVSPTQYYYWADRDLAQAIAQTAPTCLHSRRSGGARNSRSAKFSICTASTSTDIPICGGS